MKSDFFSLALQKRGYKPLFAYVGIVMCFLIFPTLIGYLVDARLFNGVSVWLKPLKFELSTGIYFVTLSFFATYVDEKYRSSKIWQILTWSATLSVIFEVGYIFLRASRGEASHFNESTLIAEIMYALMGIGALIIIFAAFQMGYFVLRSEIRSTLRLAIGWGLIATALFGGGTGIYMSMGESHWVGGLQNDAHGLPFLGWSSTGGDLRIAHIFGLHTMQIIPLFAFSKKFVWAALIIWSCLTLLLFYQAIQGLPLIC